MKKDVYLQIITTTDTKEEAEKIAHILVEKGLAACVQVIGPVTSVYQWNGKIEISAEWICQIKTIKDLYNSVEKEILTHHKYELPEIIAIPILTGSKKYLDWMRMQVTTND
ncbi:MAG TPA: divalent-cation tolerance protein CutA [Candidatus Marinimicrobia bacterium]|nr:divalent-cation tolerance protein CutA [Candidatus Neomarinimicrobiota bacterium]HQE94781.1 divalent-cation tolerance protein CutA [Candidatus Neomarinimicrobiota bacterium]HQH55684.1 divalent-cation tolerance protein CutA [Candidatus Neomarinimicrobiota bacterium]HQK11154.1 divalent-cation tolerance protein CutA [Candidatus Neomarinimicrobiota bacterium]